MDPSEEDLEQQALNKLYWGFVMDTNDPEQLGRVRCRVEGVTHNMTTWAWPIGMPGASKGGKGGFYVPRQGSMVLVGFIHGKTVQPFYLTAHRALSSDGKGDIPRAAKEQTKQDATKIHVITETDTFEIYVVDTDTEKKVVVRTLNKANMIELDAKDNSVWLKAATLVRISAPTVSIEGTNVVIKGRPVTVTGLTI